MNEVAYNLFSVTSDARHLALARSFYKRSFLEPLAQAQGDPLLNRHANQHLPIVVGAARAFEVEANATFSNITTRFSCLLAEGYTYATGGSNVNEHWQFGGQLGAAVETDFDAASAAPHNSNGFHTEETCTQV